MSKISQDQQEKGNVSPTLKELKGRHLQHGKTPDTSSEDADKGKSGRNLSKIGIISKDVSDISGLK